MRVNNYNNTVPNVPGINNGTAAQNTGFTSALQSSLNTPTSMNDIFEQAASAYGVPSNLLKAVGKAESNYNASAVSGSGAQGVMQLMPATASYLGVSDPFDAQSNIMGGAKYLAELLNQYNGDAKLALAAYNAGSNNVDKYGGIPPFKETQNYVQKVMEYAGSNEYVSQIVTPTTANTVQNGAYAGLGGANSDFSSNLNNFAALNTIMGLSGGSGLNNSGSMNSMVAPLYTAILQSIMNFQGFSQDDYLMLLEQMKLNLQPDLSGELGLTKDYYENSAFNNSRVNVMY